MAVGSSTLHGEQRVGPYELGRGAFGVVFEARRPSQPQRPVALKVIEATGGTDRHLLEAQHLSRLAHPNIVRLYDSFIDRGRVVLAMEYIEGQALDGYLREKGPQPAAVIARFLAQMADALRHAHALHLVHRDIKPSNILVQGHGEALRFVLAEAEAGALPQELEAPPAELRERHQGFVAELAAERGRQEALLRLSADHDERIGVRARAAFLLLLVPLGLALRLALAGLHPPTHAEGAGLVVAMLAIILCAAFVLRRHVMPHAHSRRLLGLLVFGALLVLVHRLLGWGRGEAIAEVQRVDLLLLTALFGGASIVGYRNLVPGALLLFGGSLVGIGAPAYMHLVFASVIVLAMISYLMLNLWGERASGERDAKG